MAIDPRTLLKSASADLRGDALMLARPEVLRGVDAAQQAALEALQIRTVFDLAASASFAAARRVLRLQDDATLPEAQLQRVAADLADAPAGVPVADLAAQPVAALKMVDPAQAQLLRSALAVTTIRDLALWPPHAAARALLAEQLASDDPPFVGDEGTPGELLPKNGAFPTERVLYRQLVIDRVSDAGLLALEAQPDALSLDDVLAGGNLGFTRLAQGALLTFSQDWFAQGVALGQLLHCLSLAPGESTRMAMIDWSRQSRGSSNEDIDEAERLANTTTHQRALSEVTEATVNEVQRGRSRTETSSSASQGGSALGFEVGPLAFGGSSGGGSTSTEALTVTSSFGRRNLAASVSQNINDVSQQQASAARSRRASIVQEVAQSEHQALSTRVVCNYNHMHALNVQYYEVVQAFRVTTVLQRAERVVFVPLKVVDFTNALVLERWRGVLADVALSDDIRRQLTTEFGVVEVAPNGPRLRVGDAVLTTAQRSASLASRLQSVLDASAAKRAPAAVPALAASPVTALAATAAAAPVFIRSAAQLQGLRLSGGSIRAEALAAAAPDAATAAAAAAEVRDLRHDLGPPQAGATLTVLKGFDSQQLSRLAALSGRPLLREASDAVFVPDDARLLGVAVTNARVTTLVVRRRDGSDVPATVPIAGQLTLETPLRMADLRGVTVTMRPDDQPGRATLRLLLDVNGAALPLDVPVVLPAVGQTAEVARFEPPVAAPALLKHLKENALHYSRAIFERLDPTTLSSLLSRFTLAGVPLGALVDPAPVAVVANALVLRLNLPTRGTAENPALAAETEAWQRFLVQRGLDRPAPQSQTIPLPSGGVFAEAVLGRFNGAEKIDLTRFFDWQASPIPLTPPEIAALPSESRQRAVSLATSALSAPLLKQTEATALPAGVNGATVLAALQAGSPFRDLSSVIAANAGLAQSGSETAGAGATAAATQAANTLQTVMAQNTERMKIAADLFLATQGGGQGDAKAKANPTAAGLAMTTADRQDRTAAQAGATSGATGAAKPGATGGGAGADGGGGDATPSLELQAQAAQVGSNVVDTVRQVIDSVVDVVGGDAAPATSAPAPAQRRGGRRVQPAPAASPVIDLVRGIGTSLEGAAGDVPFSVQFLDANGARAPKGRHQVRIVDSTGRALLQMNLSDTTVSGARPPSDKPVTYELAIFAENPAFQIIGSRRVVTLPASVTGGEFLEAKPVLARREVAIPASDVALLLLATDAELLARPEVQALGLEIERIATRPQVDVRDGKGFITFSIFAIEMAVRRLLR